jgi:hypothetical protein
VKRKERGDTLDTEISRVSVHLPDFETRVPLYDLTSHHTYIAYITPTMAPKSILKKTSSQSKPGPSSLKHNTASNSKPSAPVPSGSKSKTRPSASTSTSTSTAGSKAKATVTLARKPTKFQGEDLESESDGNQSGFEEGEDDDMLGVDGEDEELSTGDEIDLAKSGKKKATST